MLINLSKTNEFSMLEICRQDICLSGIFFYTEKSKMDSLIMAGATRMPFSSLFVPINPFISTLVALLKPSIPRLLRMCGKS